ncbi:MAG: hypothetical protein WD003_02085 [Candidatus Paceibacterota bacterium]
MGLLKWVIGMFILFGVFWFMVGGTETLQRPFLQPPAPLSSGEQYGPQIQGVTIGVPGGNESEVGIDERGSDEEVDETVSLFTGRVSFSGRARATEEDPDREYLIIKASTNNLGPVNISNWSIRSAITGKGVPTLGTGTRLYYSGRIAGQGAIFLEPGETAVVATGQSPVGTSFKLNICSGYLEQFQDFSPAIRKQCPRAFDEEPDTGLGGLKDPCLNYLEDIRRCEIIITPPLTLSNECRVFIAENLNYNSCIDNHRNEETFFLPEWRIFLRRSDELWKGGRETILLIDNTGKTVDSLSY